MVQQIFKSKKVKSENVKREDEKDCRFKLILFLVPQVIVRLYSS